MVDKVYCIDDYHPDYGNVILLHYEHADDPPAVLVSSPHDMVFHAYGLGYWTHFICVDWLDIGNQIKLINNKNSHKRATRL